MKNTRETQFRDTKTYGFSLLRSAMVHRNA
jgi:hypothetical protein